MHSNVLHFVVRVGAGELRALGGLMNARPLAALLLGLTASCATLPPKVTPETRREIQSARTVHVKVEYWRGLREFAESSLKREVEKCGSKLAFTDDEQQADLVVHYFHLQAICLDCTRRVAPDSFEIRLLRGEHEVARWGRPNVGCGEAECMVTHAMRATGKLLCSCAAPPN